MMIPTRLYIEVNKQLCLNIGQHPPTINRKLSGGKENTMGMLTTRTTIQDIEIKRIVLRKVMIDWYLKFKEKHIDIL